MGNAKNLSMSTGTNQQKIIVNSSQTVTVPISGASPDTLLTIDSDMVIRPTARVFVEIGGVLAPLSASTAINFDVFGKTVKFFASFNSSNQLVIQSYSLELSTFSATFQYRIYRDGRPS